MRDTRNRTVIIAAAIAMVCCRDYRLAEAQVLPTFHGRADLVRVDVSVRRRGRPLAGLKAVDFELLDNGVPQPIAELGYETLPIDVTVALDVSESVGGSVLEQLRRSIRDLVRDLTPRDRLRLLTFNVQITRIMDYGAPAASVDVAFDHIQPLGSTAVFDTIAVALAAPAALDRRQLVMVFSDGDDRSSITSSDVLLDVARRTTPTLGFVLPSFSLRTGAASNSSAPDHATELYGRLAAETGGFVQVVDKGESLVSAFRKSLADFRQSYVLYFAPRRVEASGIHTLAVRVTRPDVEVHARRSYSAR